MKTIGDSSSVPEIYKYLIHSIVFKTAFSLAMFLCFFSPDILAVKEQKSLFSDKNG